MDTYLITGGNRLSGEIDLQGSKNSSLPIIAASVLIDGTVTIFRCPKISDTLAMQELLRLLGCKVTEENENLIINSTTCDKDEIPEDLMKEIRSSIVFMGPMLAKHKRVVLTYPGGCEIGARPIDLHLSGLKQLGANITESHGYIICEADRLVGNEIDLDFPSVGATENIMLAAVLAKGVTIIRNAAREPEIIDLQNFLNKAGAKVIGAGSNVIKINGVEKLHDVEFEIPGDRIVAGTYLCGAAITNGELMIKGVIPEYLRSTLHKLREAGCQMKIYNKEDIWIKAPERLKSVNTIKTMPFPGFPTDMQSQLVTMLTLAQGTSIVIENIFENRYKYVSELTKMGAQITIEGKMAVIKGVKKLMGATVEARELRGGASLVLAGLAAEGRTKVNGIHYIERGYENFVENLQGIGAFIEKI